MSKARSILERYEPISQDAVYNALVKRFDEIGLEGITVESVLVDYEGEIIVNFQDDEDGEVDIMFFYDQDEGAMAIILDDEDADEWVTIELDPVNPPLKNTPFGTYIDMTNLYWLNYSTIKGILEAGELSADDDPQENTKQSKYAQIKDKYGFIKIEDTAFTESTDTDLEIDERKVSVVRGGKRVRLPVVRRKRRRIMTGKQRAAARRGARKRKARKSAIGRKRKKSLRVRRRMNIKSPNLGKHRKAAGTADRKR